MKNARELLEEAREAKYCKGRVSLNAADWGLYSDSAVGFAYEVSKRHLFDNVGGLEDTGRLENLFGVLASPLVFVGNFITAPLYREKD